MPAAGLGNRPDLIEWPAPCPPAGLAQCDCQEHLLAVCELELYLTYYVTYRCLRLLESDCTRLCNTYSKL